MSSLYKGFLWGILVSTMDFYVHDPLRQSQILGGSLSEKQKRSYHETVGSSKVEGTLAIFEGCALTGVQGKKSSLATTSRLSLHSLSKWELFPRVC